MAVLSRLTGDVRLDNILRSLYTEMENIRKASIIDPDIDTKATVDLSRVTTAIAALRRRVQDLEEEPAYEPPEEEEVVDTTPIPFTHTKITATNILLGIRSTRLVNSYLLADTPLVKMATTYATDAEFLAVFA